MNVPWEKHYHIFMLICSVQKKMANILIVLSVLICVNCGSANSICYCSDDIVAVFRMLCDIYNFIRLIQ